MHYEYLCSWNWFPGYIAYFPLLRKPIELNTGFLFCPDLATRNVFLLFKALQLFFTPEDVRALLTEDVINKLRVPSLRKKI